MSGNGFSLIVSLLHETFGWTFILKEKFIQINFEDAKIWKERRSPRAVRLEAFVKRHDAWAT